MSMHQQIQLIFRIHIAEMADPLDRFIHPQIQIRLSAFIFQVIFDNARELPVIGTAVLFPVNILLYDNFICQCLIGRLQYDPAKIASSVKFFQCNTATMKPDSSIPARCWMAPEIPRAR